MGWIRPFRKVEKQNDGVDESRQDEADQKHRECIPNGFRQTHPAQEQEAER
jgi:hypothetical protein